MKSIAAFGLSLLALVAAQPVAQPDVVERQFGSSFVDPNVLFSNPVLAQLLGSNSQLLGLYQNNNALLQLLSLDPNLSSLLGSNLQLAQLFGADPNLAELLIANQNLAQLMFATPQLFNVLALDPGLAQLLEANAAFADQIVLAGLGFSQVLFANPGLLNVASLNLGGISQFLTPSVGFGAAPSFGLAGGLAAPSIAVPPAGNASAAPSNAEVAAPSPNE